MYLDKKTLRNIFLLVLGCIVVYWVLHEPERFNAIYGTFKEIFSPFVWGAGIAFILNVPMRGIENKWLHKIEKPGLRRGLAILITCIFFLAALAVVFWLLIPQVWDTVMTLINRLPGFFQNTVAAVEEFLADNPDLWEWVNTNVIQAFDPSKLTAMLEGVMDQVTNSVTTILSSTISTISAITGGIYNAIMAIAFAVYCLSSKETLARQAKRLAYAILPEHWADYTIRVMRLANSTFSNFLSGQFVEVIILGSLFAICMAIFGMPYIPLVSVLIAITAFIPIVGAFIGCFFGAFFILVEDPMMAVWFIAMFLVLQQIENNLIYPRVVGSSVGLPSMWVLVAVAVGGELMGVVGMFLMIPMASVFYALLREFATHRLELKGISAEKYESTGEQTPEAPPEENDPARQA